MSDFTSKGEPRYMISIAAEILQLHPQTLRLYEREGLVAPTRSRGNIRLYSDQDLEQIRLMQRLISDLGVNLAGAEVIINMRETIFELHRQLDILRRELDIELS